MSLSASCFFRKQCLISTSIRRKGKATQDEGWCPDRGHLRARNCAAVSFVLGRRPLVVYHHVFRLLVPREAEIHQFLESLLGKLLLDLLVVDHRGRPT